MPSHGTPDEDRGADARTAELIDELAAIEDRLDPIPAKKGQRLADLILIAVIALLTLLADVELRYPVILIALLFGARGLNRVVPFLRNRSLHAHRNRLLDPERRDPGHPDLP